MKKLGFVFLLFLVSSLFGSDYNKSFEKSMQVYPTTALVKFLNESSDIDRVKIPVLVEFAGYAIKGAYISTFIDNYESNIISIDMKHFKKNPFAIMRERCPDKDKCVLWMSGEFKNSTLTLREIHEELKDYLHATNINIYITKK